MLLTSFEQKRFFFDREEVKARIGEKKAAFLRNAGGYFQTVASRSMRSVGKKGKPSKPGKPPMHHGGYPSLRTILYALTSTNSIVIGPVRLNQKHELGGELQTGAVPQVHEFGGVIGHREKFKPFSFAAAVAAFGKDRAKAYVRYFGITTPGKWKEIYGDEFEHRKDVRRNGIWVPAGKKRRDRLLMRTRPAKYPARPYMEPAAQKTAKKFPMLWFGRGTDARGAA